MARRSLVSPFLKSLAVESADAMVISVFSLVSCVAAVHGIRAAMASLKKTGTDFTSAKGMDPKAFFEVMGEYPDPSLPSSTRPLTQFGRPARYHPAGRAGWRQGVRGGLSSHLRPQLVQQCGSNSRFILHRLSHPHIWLLYLFMVPVTHLP